MEKVRHVARAFSDSQKDMIVHSRTTLRPLFIRIILSPSALTDFHIFMQDVTQEYSCVTYLQLKENVMGQF